MNKTLPPYIYWIFVSLIWVFAIYLASTSDVYGVDTSGLVILAIIFGYFFTLRKFNRIFWAGVLLSYVVAIVPWLVDFGGYGWRGLTIFIGGIMFAIPLTILGAIDLAFFKKKTDKVLTSNV